MTIFKQFTVLATGSTLLPRFRKLRLQISLIIAFVLILLFTLSAFFLSSATSYFFSLEIAQQDRQLSNITKVIERISKEKEVDLFSDRELENLRRRYSRVPRARTRVVSEQVRDIQKTVNLVNIILFIVILILAWFVIGYLLLPLSNSIEQKEKFLAQASHDLKTPLAVAYSEIQLLETNQQIVYSDILPIKEQIKKLQSLSHSLLKNYTENIKVEIDVHEVIVQSWSYLNKFNQKNITLEIESFEISLFAQKDKFERLVINILDNVCKYANSDSTLVIQAQKRKLTFSNDCLNTIFQKGVGIKISDELANSMSISVERKIDQKTKQFITILKF